jgi:uncharacterized protein (TIGR03118 family)
MTRHQFPSSRSPAVRCSVGLAFLFVLAATAQAGNTFSVTNLVTNDQTVNSAQITDPNLVNPWGVSFTPTSPLWVSDNGTGVSSLYSITNNDHVSIVTTPAPSLFPVTIPGGSPTGQIANTNTAAFGGDAFVFVSTSGAVTGWQPSFGNTAQVIVAANSANSYDGAAQVTVGGDTYLLAANNKTGNIDVIAGNAGAPALSGTFKDPNLPAGSMPYNVQTLNNVVYVTYTNNIVDAFSTSGAFLGRVGTNGTLSDPWGLAIAPSSFGSLAGDLLVGNLASGQISVFGIGSNNTFTALGVLNGANGAPIVIPDLWSLYVGNNVASGSNQQVYFTAGSNGYADGLLGAIQAVPEPSSAVLGLIAVGVLAGRWQWKNRRRAV